MASFVETVRPAHGDAITWFGHACFRITDAEGHTVLIDPYNPEVMGQSLQGVTADVVLITHEHRDHNTLQGVEARHIIHALQALTDGQPQKVGDPPTGMIFTIIPTRHDDQGGNARGDNAAVVWQEGGLTFCHLGDLGHRLTPEQVDQIGRPDVLMIPVGGKYTIDGAEARRVVAQLKPHIVIPMHYMVPGRTRPDMGIATADSFLAADGQAPWQDVQHVGAPMLIVDADDLTHGTVVDVLDPATTA